MNRFVLLFALLAVGCNDESRLSIVSFNAWGAGANDGRTVAATLAVLEAMDADVIALQEVRAESPGCTASDCPPAGSSAARALAAALGYHLYEQAGASDLLWANAILSRYPIQSVLPGELGVLLDVDGKRVALFNVHLGDYPYQPYQLTGIAYGDAPLLHDEDTAIGAAQSARGGAINALLLAAAEVADADLKIICGDFNEPSHLDWTARAAASGRQPMKVAFPSSRRLAEAGFVDAFRAVWPDEVARPGFTWTPLAATDDPDEHHDRIDFVYVIGDGVRVASALVFGEAASAADRVVLPWPSDHRAVRAEIRF